MAESSSSTPTGGCRNLGRVVAFRKRPPISQVHTQSKNNVGQTKWLTRLSKLLSAPFSKIAVTDGHSKSGIANGLDSVEDTTTTLSTAHSPPLQGVNMFAGANKVSFNGTTSINVFYNYHPAPMIIGHHISGITLVDAIGRTHEVPISLAVSYEMFLKTIRLILDGRKLEARIQRRYVEDGLFDLCIDQGRETSSINAQVDWSVVKPGSKVILRVILWKRKASAQRYLCPRPGCGVWNNLEDADKVSIDCKGCDGCFMVSDHKIRSQSPIVDSSDAIGSEDYELALIRNFHLKLRNNYDTLGLYQAPRWILEQWELLLAKYPKTTFVCFLRRKINGPRPQLPKWKIKCLDCPGKLYDVGPLQTLSNFEIHLRNRQHHDRVQSRHELGSKS